VAHPVWAAVRQRLQDTVSREEFETWIAPLSLVVIEDDLAVLATPNVFVRNEINQHYADAVTAALAAELGRSCRVELVIDQQVAA
jgi:chromosomal replication initiator protein